MAEENTKANKPKASGRKPKRDGVLSFQRERFCQEYVKCGDQSAAFRIAYPTSKGWKDKLVWSHASELMRDGKVKVRVAELRKQTENKLGMSREKWLGKWVKLANGRGEPGDRMRALENIGKALGYYAPEKHEVNVTGTILHVDLTDRITVLDLEIDKAMAEAFERKRVEAVDIEAVPVDLPAQIVGDEQQVESEPVNEGI